MLLVPPPKYQVDDQVLIKEIYVVDQQNGLTIVKLDKTYTACVEKNKGSSSLGYSYVLDIDFANNKRPSNLAKVCYWEDNILTKIDIQDESFWKVWGER
jgi:hypothetical protein